MTDRLALIKARHAEAGGGNGDLEWLVAEVERLRVRLREDNETMLELETRIKALDPSAFLDEALNSGNGEYRP